MAYTPINWQTGDTITAEKLNKCDNGWSVESSSTELCSESVTTTVGQMGLPEAVLSYAQTISASSITVTLNGTDYTCPKQEANGQYFYGGFDAENSQPDFSTFPFFLWSNSGTNTLYTENAGTYTIKITSPSITVETSANFQTAVNSFLVSEIFIAIQNQTTWQAVYDAVSSGKIVCIVADEADYKSMRFVAKVGTDSGGNYHIEAVAVLNSAVDVANYYANSASDPIYPN